MESVQPHAQAGQTDLTACQPIDNHLTSQASQPVRWLEVGLSFLTRVVVVAIFEAAVRHPFDSPHLTPISEPSRHCIRYFKILFGADIGSIFVGAAHLYDGVCCAQVVLFLAGVTYPSGVKTIRHLSDT